MRWPVLAIAWAVLHSVHAQTVAASVVKFSAFGAAGVGVQLVDGTLRVVRSDDDHQPGSLHNGDGVLTADGAPVTLDSAAAAVEAVEQGRADVLMVPVMQDMATESGVPAVGRKLVGFIRLQFVEPSAVTIEAAKRSAEEVEAAAAAERRRRARDLAVAEGRIGEEYEVPVLQLPLEITLAVTTPAAGAPEGAKSAMAVTAVTAGGVIAKVTKPGDVLIAVRGTSVEEMSEAGTPSVASVQSLRSTCCSHRQRKRPLCVRLRRDSSAAGLG
jgi:hypothetical protein